MNEYIRYLVRFLIVLGGLSLGTWLAYQTLDNRSLGFDDAHIFLVYGRNLAAGFGPTYNIGEAWVEGFTSPIWMILIALAYLVTNSPEFLLLVLSLLLASTAIARLWLYIDNEFTTPLFGLILLVWVFGSPYFVIWNSITLMDTAVWMAVLVWAVVLAIDINTNPLYLAAVMPVMVFTRPEAIIWGALLILVRGSIHTRKFGRKNTWEFIRLPLLAYVASLVVLIMIRMLVYGYPLPNTYYAKQPPSLDINLFHGTLYLAGFFVTNWPVLIIFCLTISILILNLPRLIKRRGTSDNQQEAQSRIRLIAMAMITVIALFIPVFEGGDYFHGFRFYQSAWPLLILPLIAFLDYFRLTRSRPMVLGTLLLIVIASFFLVTTTWINRDYLDSVNIELAIADRGELTGNNLNALFDDPRPSIGVIAAGSIALTYDGQVIDLVGLNNEEMAHLSRDREGPKSHSAFDPEIFYRQLPEIVLPFGGTPEKVLGFWHAKYGWHNEVMKGTLETERFHDLYQFAKLSSPMADAQIIAFVKRSYLDTLVDRSVEVEILTEPESTKE